MTAQRTPAQIVDRLKNAPQLPMDAGGNPIPCMTPRPGKAHTISVTASAAKNTVAFDPQTQVLSFYASTDVFMEFGDSDVVATSASHFFPAGVFYNFALRHGVTHISVIRSFMDGNAYISEYR